MNTPDKRVEEIVRQTHTFLPVDLKDREEFLQYLETALTQYHQDLMSEVVRRIEKLEIKTGNAEAKIGGEAVKRAIIKSLSK